jgi:hypothetical protein
MNTDETPNPITNAKIVSVDTDPGVYHRTKGGFRGTPDCILSNTQIKRILECANKWLIGGSDHDDTDATRWGSLVDCMGLTMPMFNSRYAISPATYRDAKTGEEKAWNWNANVCKAWREQQGDREVIKPDMAEGAALAVKRLYDDPEICKVLRNSQKQVFIVGEYHDASTGLVVPLKGLLDIVPDVELDFYGKCLADLKTTEKAGCRGWPRKVFLWGLHIQAALYLDLYTAATGEDRTDFLHVISESEPPYEPNRVLLTSGSDMDFVELGRSAYLAALKFYARCLKEDHWPGYAEMSDQRIHGWAVVQPEAWMIGGGAVIPQPEEPEEDGDKPQLDNNDIMP